MHGEEEALKVLKTSEELFKDKNINSDNMPFFEMSVESKFINVIDFISMTPLVTSKSETRRLLLQNGFEINGKKVNIDTLIDLEKEENIVIKKGKKTFLKVIIRK